MLYGLNTLQSRTKSLLRSRWIGDSGSPRFSRSSRYATDPPVKPIIYKADRLYGRHSVGHAFKEREGRLTSLFATSMRVLIHDELDRSARSDHVSNNAKALANK